MVIKRLIQTAFLLIQSLALYAWATQPVVNVYNWANYMPSSVIKQFEKETGIHVNYLEFDSNETLYAKIKADPHIAYDVIFPSSYYVSRMKKEHMLKQLDRSAISNIKYINPLLLNQPYDPNNEYSVPYLFGATGLVINSQYYKTDVLKNWNDLWNPAFKNQLLLLNDMREVFSAALISLGYSINDTNPKHIKAAFERLKKLLPNVRVFNSDADINIYIDEDATLGMGWSGDIYQAQQENPSIQFIYPNGRFPISMDCMAIPKYAPHYQSALKFIQFLSRPEIAKKIALYTGYSSPNAAAIKLMPKTLQENPVLNPNKTLLKRAESMDDVGSADAVYEHYWQILLLG